MNACRFYDEGRGGGVSDDDATHSCDAPAKLHSNFTLFFSVSSLLDDGLFTVILYSRIATYLCGDATRR